MESLFQIRGLGLFIVAVLDFILAFLLYSRSKGGKKDVFNLSIVSLFSGFYALFCSGVYLFWNSNSFISILLYRATWLGILILPPFVLFTYYFIGEIKRIKLKAFILYLGAGTISFLALTTSFFVKTVYLRYPHISGIAGPLDLIGRLYILACIIVALFNLLKEYSQSTGFRKLQLKYFVLGASIYAFGGIIFTSIIPILIGESPYYDIVSYLSFIWVALTAYAIVAKRLFGIKVILTELLVGLIAILLLINIIGSKTTFEYAWKGSLFFTFLFFGWLLIKSVIREIKQREKLDKLATQLAASNIRLESAYKKLQKLDKAKTEFISIASHQLRTPLTAIKGYISMILEGSYGKIPEKVERPMENVFKSNERLIKLVNELLNVSRIESGRVKLSKEEASLEEIISNIVEELKVEAENKGIYLKFAPLDNKHLTGQEKPLPKTLIDKDKIRQVILNIVDNAIKYTENGGVTIKLKMEDEKCRIEISDTGTGITKEEIGSLFQSFKRGTAGNKLWTEGTGLGLYVAKKFVEMHQGKIWAESPGKGKGSTFFIELPA